MIVSTVCLEMSGRELKNLRHTCGVHSVIVASSLFGVSEATWQRWETDKIKITHPGLVYKALIGHRLELEQRNREREAAKQ